MSVTVSGNSVAQVGILMSSYLELPEFDGPLKFRAFLNDGLTIVNPHFHKEIEMIYAKRGMVRIGLGDELVELAEGEIIYFASGVIHYFLASPESERYVYQFDLSIFDEVDLGDSKKSLMSLFDQGAPCSRTWPEELYHEVKEILELLYQSVYSSLPGTNYLILSNLYRLIGKFYQELPMTNSRKNHADFPITHYQETLKQINQIFDYIELHYQDVITLDDVANAVGFSPYYFTRLFKKNTGKTFTQFLTEYRINRAKFILGNEKIPMVEVAEKSGFASVKTFHHVFKDAVGMPPLQYQKQLNLK